MINQLNTCSNVPFIQVTTNGSIDVSCLNQQNVEFIFSWHNQYDNSKLLENVKKVKRYFISYQADKEMPEVLRDFNVYVNPISGLKQRLSPLHQSRYLSNGKEFVESDVTRLRLNRFKGYRCKLRWYSFTVDGKLLGGCSDKIKGVEDEVTCPNDCCSCGIASLGCLKYK